MARASTPAVELEVAGRTVRISSPAKIYFAHRGLTKLDVVQYFLSVGEGIMRALKDRPTTLERWPGGYFEGATLSTRADHRGDAFYSKRVPQGAPDFVESVSITFPSGRRADEVCPTELAVVAWAANLGTLRFHPWPVTTVDVDHPDQLRIDLDPQPGTDFSDAAVVAPLLREVLQEFGMDGYPKTSGGRGLHVYVPIEPTATFVQARRAVIALGRELERRRPEAVTTSWWKEERGERIFVDFNQMARDRTMASAYSVRPNARATVSAPLTWEEVPLVGPEDFDVLTMPARFAQFGDLHAGLDGPRYDIAPLLELAERDDRDRGLGDLPYPPEYPKMPGEPKRVQPSRDTDRHRAGPGTDGTLGS
jgi:DNA ligase D-like protein (predicted polymerase)